MPDCFITRRLPGPAVEWLGGRMSVLVGPENRYSTAEEIHSLVREARALVSWLPDKITREVMDAAPGLKIIANYGAGTDNIDVGHARSRGIIVTNTPDVLSDATADIAMALVLGCARQLYAAERFVREGHFKGWEPQLFIGNDLKGKRLGLFGMGSIGRAMARRARGFGMKTVYHNRNRLSEAMEAEVGARYVPFDELVATSDYISLHCPLNDQSRHRFTKAEFDRMKRGVYFINTARGAVVKESDLLDALLSGQVKAAGLDVYEFEPKITEGLLQLPNVMLLPHIGSATIETRQTMAMLAVENVALALAGEPPKTPVG